MSAKVVAWDIPRAGERLMVAYDPLDPAEMVVLLSERDYASKLKAYVRSAVHHGIEAPCEVLAAEATGRVSRPDPLPEPGRVLTARAARELAAQVPRSTSPAPETWLTLRVHPPGAEAFEVSRMLWDRDLGLAPGLRGVFFYHPHEPHHGYPVFPTARHRETVGDPLQVARDEFVEHL